MSEIPEAWEDWFKRLSVTLADLDDLAHRYEAEITLPAAMDAEMAEEAPGITAWDQWLSLIQESVWSPSAHGLEMDVDRKGFHVHYCFAVDAIIFSIKTELTADQFPSDKLTDHYLRLLDLFGELWELPEEMARSFCRIPPESLIELVPKRFILQDLLFTAGRSAHLMPGQAVLAFELDPFALEFFPEAMEACRSGLDFHADTFSSPLDAAWDDYLEATASQEGNIHAQASEESLAIAHLDDSLIEQVLVFGYLSVDNHHEAAAILSHLLNKHYNDPECEEAFGIGPANWWQWLSEAIDNIKEAGGGNEIALTAVGGLPDPVAQRILTWKRAIELESRTVLGASGPTFIITHNVVWWKLKSSGAKRAESGDMKMTMYSGPRNLHSRKGVR